MMNRLIKALLITFCSTTVSGLVQASPLETVEFYDPLKTSPLASTPFRAHFSDIECGQALPQRLTMVVAVNAAICRDPRIQQAWSITQAAGAQVGIGRSAYLPNINVQGSVSQVEQDFRDFDFPDQQSQRFTLSLEWLVFDFGRKARQEAFDQAQVRQAQGEQEDVIQNVVFETLTRFYDAIQAQAALTTKEEAQRLAQASVHIVEQRLAGGAVTAADLIQVQATHARAQLERQQAEIEVRQRIARLNQLLGSDLARQYELVDPSRANWSALEQRYPDLLRAAELSHPRILAAQARLQALYEQLGLARTAYYPSVTATAEYQYEFDRDDKFRNSRPESNTQLGMQINMPLFTGFRNHYQTQRSQHELAAGQAQFNQVGEEVRLDLWQSFQLWRDTQDQVALSELLFDQAARAELVTRQRYIEGVGNIFDWITAQENLAQAKLTRVNAYNQQNTSMAQLARASGNLGIWLLR